MSGTFDIWLFGAGLGLFLLGMDQLERGVHALAGDSFRGMLRRATGHPLRSIFIGLFATGLLQSSSILGLMVLALVGASILPMRNAIGVILGSNVGSTLTGWLVAAIGFKLDLEAMSLPFIALGALGVVFAVAESRVHSWSSVLLALGLLLLGMQNMITSADAFAQGFDPAALAGKPVLVFFAAGILITVVVRTSAATIMIALSAMNAGVLDLHQAAAVAIGADLGTTSTMMIAAVRGIAAKKQIALCHVLFNTITDVLALFLLLPHIDTLVGWYGIEDPLFGLTAFHTTFNVLGVLLFYPFIPRLGTFLERRFQGGEESVALFLSKVPASEKAVAFSALDDELRALYRRVLALNLRAMKLEVPDVLATVAAAGSPSERLGELFGARQTFSEDYESIKRLEGEVLDFVRRLQSQKLTDDESHRLSLLLISTREAVQAAKAIKDVRGNLVEFRHSGNDWLQEYVAGYNAAVLDFYRSLAELMLRPHHELLVTDMLERLSMQEAGMHEAMKQRTYTDDLRSGLSDLEFSTVLNVLHEVHTANRALLRGARALMLDEIPG
ncbi:MAG: Na/Pi cotransporter family protein [Gammaproteobacteria bacterium]